MSSYQYGTTLCRNRHEAITMMTEDYLLAQGMNDWDMPEVQAALAAPDATAADMVADGWNEIGTVGMHDAYGDPLPMQHASVDEIASAIRELAEEHALATA